MVAVQSGNTHAGRWITEQRNIVDDYRQAFGRYPPEIIGIGMMTDTDDTGEETTGYYHFERLPNPGWPGGFIILLKGNVNS